MISESMLEAMEAGDDPFYRGEGGLTMSALGGCKKKGAYLVSRTEKEPEEPREDGSAPAAVGTALHKAILPYMAAALDGKEEVISYLMSGDVKIYGTADLVLEDAVWDLKTVGRYGYDLLEEPKLAHVYQVTAAGLALDKSMGGVMYLDRDTGRRATFEFAIADKQDELIDWLADVVDAAKDPEMEPRGARGPGIDKECDWCPFTVTCWGEAIFADVQSMLIHDDADTEEMLLAYSKAGAAEKKAKGDKAFARKCLSDSEGGQYGDFRLTWKQNRDSEYLDKEKVIQVLTENDLQIPMVVRPGAVSISVSRSKK